MKCDGARPSCSRCVKSHVECTYDEEIKKSKITLLRDEIGELKKRILELEADTIAKAASRASANQSASPAGLPTTWSDSPAVSDTHSFGQSQFRVMSPDQKPPPFMLAQPSVDPYQQYSELPGAEGFQAPILHNATGWREPAPSHTGALIIGQMDQIPTDAETLHNLDVIMPYRIQCAFEIDVASLQESLADPDPNNRPHDALLNAIALMACYYGQSPHRAPVFVERTRRCLQNSLTGIRSRKVIQQIQAGHLLACYLYWTGSLLEGHAALANAVSLARLCNLHKITSSDWRNRNDNLLEEPSAFRPQLRPLPSVLNHYPARNATEHGERIHCFWNLLLVDTGGSVSTGYPCQFTASDSDPGTKIETVYPLSLQDYLSVSARAQEPTSSYGDIFYPRLISAAHDSPLVARIKAALLLHRAARLGTVGKAAQGGPDHEFSSQWVNLNECIDVFVNSLREIPVSPQTRPRGDTITEERREFLYMFIAWALALCAQVVMYTITPLAWRNTQMQGQAWVAADRIVQLIVTANPSEDEFKMLDVMVGFSWMTAANFLINMRNQYELGSDKSPANFDLQYAERQLDILEQAAELLAKTCKPVVRQAQGTKEFRARSSGPYQAAPVQAPQTWNS